MTNMAKIRSLGVFCGSANGKNPAFMKAAAELGGLLGKNGIRLIYGAGHTGLMGAVAEGALNAGGEVVGIINDLLQSREIPRLKLSELKVLPSMHVRKDAMVEASDAFCVLPGGIGTLDEVFEIVTLKQIGELSKPIVLYNAFGFWEPYRAIINTLIDEGFVRPEHANLVTYVDTVEGILPAIEAELEENERKKAG